MALPPLRRVAALGLFMLLLALPVLAWADYQVEVNKGVPIRLATPATSVLVADPEIADVQVVSPKLLYINGRQVGETSLLVVDEQDNQIMHATIEVTHNLSKLNKTLSNAMPGSNVQFDSVDGALVMRGDVASPIEAENLRELASPFLREGQNLINLVDTKGSNQVTLMVRVAEVSRSELKRFGIHLENLFSAGDFLFGLATGRDVVNAAGTFLRSPTGDSSVGVSYDGGDTQVNGVIDALESDGLMTVLAEPNLTTMSGQPANFLAGGEFPIPVMGEDGAVTIEYREYGVGLNFTPTVLSNDRINLNVSPEVSTLSSAGAVTLNGFNVPSLTTRRASATVELASGQTFAIAGLLQNNDTNDIDKFPGLGDVPVLGALFRSNEFQKNQTELVILVTPYTVKPVSDPSSIALPTDGYQPPSDLERILFGKLYKEETNATYRPRLNGPAGYIMP